jgi:hypothetical protein
MYYEEDSTGHYELGHDDSISGLEYESIKNIINEVHSCDMTALEVRSEFELAYNKIFDNMMVDYSDKIFDVLYVLMEEFNIDEIKAVRYLNEKNKDMVRNFAISTCNTFYYETKEKQQQKEKALEKGKVYHEHVDIRDLFE